MILKHYDIKTPAVKPPADEGWEQLWSGYFWMSRCISQEFRKKWIEPDQPELSAQVMTESQFHQDCFLSILADIKREQANMFELGAGFGRTCLNLAGVINFKLIPLVPQRYRCLSVEAEPTHYQWAKEHFETQGINATVLNAAVSNKNGTCRFLVEPNPASQYGQAMSPLLSQRKIPSVLNIRRFVTGRTIKIPMYSIDHLIKTYEFDRVDILQMDVQGAEDKAIMGAARSIQNNLIDYILINVHAKELSGVLRRLLSPDFDLIVDVPRDSIGKVDGFPPIMCHDGIQLYKRKNL